jgi:hypothetical protein
MWVAAAVAVAAMGLVFGGAGCDTTESTPASKAKVGLNPGGVYEVTSFSWLNAPTNAAAAAEGEENGEEGDAAAVQTPSVLTVTGAARDDGGWDLTISTDAGGSYPAVAEAGTAVKPTGGKKSYEAGARVAEYALSGVGVSGQITVYATAPIPLDIRRATNAPAASGTSTNAASANEAVGMHGVHRISPDNARCELDATLQGLSATLKAKASAGSGEITW